MNDRPILFFDSGIGGLTVFYEARFKIPGYPFIYVADDNAFPYGNWSEKDLVAHSLSLFQKLIAQYNPILTIIACNTVSTLILKKLREKYPFHHFVGTVPAIKPAAEYTKSGLISVLATKGTIERSYTHDLVAAYAKNYHVTLVGSSNLARYAEEYLQNVPVNLEKIKEEIMPCFVKKDKKYTDIVVLACTHYPFLIHSFRKVVPWPVDWLNPAESIAQQAQNLLKINNIKASEKIFPSYAFFTSNSVSFFKKNILTNFGLTLKEFS